VQARPKPRRNDEVPARRRTELVVDLVEAGDRAIAIMQRNGVTVETLRAVDHRIATGVHPDMTELLAAAPRLHDPAAVRRRVGRRAGPGPSYLDAGSGGPENDFTNRNSTFLAWNLLHLARMLKDAGGSPAHGNQRAAWDAGCRLDFVNPEARRSAAAPPS
jgi:hypothetical protein